MKNKNGLIKKYYIEGKLAALKGLEMENPYYDGTPEATSWDIGYLSIEDDNKDVKVY